MCSSDSSSTRKPVNPVKLLIQCHLENKYLLLVDLVTEGNLHFGKECVMVFHSLCKYLLNPAPWLRNVVRQNRNP